MSLQGNPLFCDQRMKWIQLAEQDGWISFPHFGKPVCINYNQPWDLIVLPGDLSCLFHYSLTCLPFVFFQTDVSGKIFLPVEKGCLLTL